jgi:hypothetical protein
LQRFYVCMYYIVDCVWLGCPKCLTRVLCGHDWGVRCRLYICRCDRYNRTIITRYDVCVFYIVEFVWLGCHKCLTRVLPRAWRVLDEYIINEGVIDTIEQLLQRYDVFMYYKVDCVWLGCHKCLTRVLQGHDWGVGWRHCKWRCDRPNRTIITKIWCLYVLYSWLCMTRMSQMPD